jgi:restriction system protein
MANVWGIHTKDDYLFLKSNVIAIGWRELGDLSKIKDNRDAFKERYTEVYPNEKKGSIATCAGMLYRFIYEIKIGDYVIYPSKINREINIGIVEGNYTYVDDAAEYVQQRKVKWIKRFPRTVFSQGALYEVGSAMTLFAVKNYADEYLAALDKDFKKSEVISEDEDESVAATAEQIQESTKDYIIKELSKNCKGYPLEDVVNDLLNAMGYRTKQSKQGGDSGIDIVAFKDELPPRIVVQVKSSDSFITENLLQSFKGAMAPGDYGWFVTLSDYKPNAKNFLEANPQISGINGAQLAELIMKYYSEMSDKYKKLIPLKRVYIPVVDEG